MNKIAFLNDGVEDYEEESLTFVEKLSKHEEPVRMANTAKFFFKDMR